MMEPKPDMPRIRTIKPEFFQHEGLYDAERESGFPLRIAFAGLWTVADKAGRFEWRPRQLKLNVLPYDDCDFTAVLSALESHGFIRRYELDGKSFGCIPSWTAHQHLNVREPDSSIPGPDEEQAAQVQAPDKAGASTDLVPAQAAGKGRERERERERNARERDDSPPDANLQAEADRPPGLDPAAWDRWHDYRVKIRRPLKPVSIPAAQRELAAFGCNQAAVVEQSIAQGWTGVFELKRGMNGSRPPGRRLKTADEIEAEERAHAVG